MLYRSADAHEATCVKEALIGSKVEFRSWYGDGVHRQPHFHNVSRDALEVTDSNRPDAHRTSCGSRPGGRRCGDIVSALELGASRSR